MKYLIILLLIFHCSNKKGYKVLNNINYNDTTCLGNLENFRYEDFELMGFCHVVLSDSLSKKFDNLIGSGELSKISNFDKAGNKLKFSIHNQIISFEILSQTSLKNKIEPEIMYMRGDTLYLREKLNGVIDYTFSRKFHKTIYQVKLKRGISNITLFMLENRN